MSESNPYKKRRIRTRTEYNPKISRYSYSETIHPVVDMKMQKQERRTRVQTPYNICSHTPSPMPCPGYLSQIPTTRVCAGLSLTPRCMYAGCQNASVSRQLQRERKKEKERWNGSNHYISSSRGRPMSYSLVQALSSATARATSFVASFSQLSRAFSGMVAGSFTSW